MALNYPTSTTTAIEPHDSTPSSSLTDTALSPDLPNSSMTRDQEEFKNGSINDRNHPGDPPFLPCIDTVISGPIEWNPSTSTDYLCQSKRQLENSFSRGKKIYPYMQLEHPSRNGVSSMPHICIFAEPPPSILTPLENGYSKVDPLHYSHKQIASSVNLDQFGLPIWSPSSVIEQEAELVALIKYLEPTTLEQDQQLLLFNSISEITSRLFTNSSLVRFGSTVNGFSLREADVDFCLFVGKDHRINADEDRSNIPEIVLTALGAALVGHERYTQIKVLTRARVPIIKLKDSLTGISCDIGVNNSLALHNTRLLFLYGQYDQRVTSLARIIKWWARKRAMNDSYWGTLSSYCLLMMLIFYLQQGENPVLPILTSESLIDEFREWKKKSTSTFSPQNESSISELLAQCTITAEPSFKNFIASFYESSKNEAGIVDTIVDEKFSVKYISDIVSLKKMISPHIEHRSLHSLLSGFFKFYTQVFSFSTQVVSPRTGIALSKESKQWTIQHNTSRDSFWFCVEDPFDLSQNLTRVVTYNR